MAKSYWSVSLTLIVVKHFSEAHMHNLLRVLFLFLTQDYCWFIWSQQELECWKSWRKLLQVVARGDLRKPLEILIKWLHFIDLDRQQAQERLVVQIPHYQMPIEGGLLVSTRKIFVNTLKHTWTERISAISWFKSKHLTSSLLPDPSHPTFRVLSLFTERWIRWVTVASLLQTYRPTDYRLLELYQNQKFVTRKASGW